MPFYRHEENYFDADNGAGFAPEDVPCAVVAVGGTMVLGELWGKFRCRGSGR